MKAKNTDFWLNILNSEVWALVKHMQIKSWFPILKDLHRGGFASLRGPILHLFRWKWLENLLDSIFPHLSYLRASFFDIIGPFKNFCPIIRLEKPCFPSTRQPSAGTALLLGPYFKKQKAGSVMRVSRASLWNTWTTLGPNKCLAWVRVGSSGARI